LLGTRRAGGLRPNYRIWQTWKDRSEENNANSSPKIGSELETTFKPNQRPMQTPRRSDLTANEDSRSKTAGKNNPQIKQSTEDTRCDQPSNLIPHDKDHAGDPWSFVPIFHSESTRINIFQQRGERHLKKRTNPASNVKRINTPQT
jgi:hypothetical protein